MLKVFVLLAALLVLANAVAIEHVLLSLTGDLNEMQVTFRTRSKPANPAVKYGVGTTSTTVAIPASQVSYFRNSTSSTAAITYLSVIVLKGLQRGATYTYAVTDNTKASPVVWKTSSFKTFSAASSFPIRLALFGDMGSGSTLLDAANPGSLNKYVANNAIDGVLHFGDLAYNLDSYSGRRGASFMKAISPISSRVPYIVGAGNHEYARNSFGYYNAFFTGQKAMGQRSGSTDPTTFFSFDIGTAHFVMINTEYICTAENKNVTKVSAQYKWLKADLAKAAATNKWIIVLGHRMMYNGYYQDYASTLLREGIQCTDSTWSSCKIARCSSATSTSCGYGMEKLFVDYKVDMIFQGHIHYYKRQYPCGNGVWEQQANKAAYVNPQYPVSIITGIAGTTADPDGDIAPQKRDEIAEEDGGLAEDFTEAELVAQAQARELAELAEANAAGNSTTALPTPKPYTSGTTPNTADTDGADAADTAAAAAALPTYVVAYGSDTTPSWTLLTITDATHLSIKQIASQTGKVIDQFTITHSGTSRAAKKTRAFTPSDDTVCNQ